MNKMKRYRIVLMLTLALIALTYLNISEAYAQKPVIPSSYDVTTNYHGIDVPPGAEVTATATTTDTTVTGVPSYGKTQMTTYNAE